MDLAFDHLPVGTEQRRERAELEPAQIQLAPFLHVLRAALGRAGGAILLRRTDLADLVAGLLRIAADIVRPVRNARHRDADAGRDLVVQVIPAARRIAAPHRDRIALDASEARARQDKLARIRLVALQSLVEALRMHRLYGLKVIS